MATCENMLKIILRWTCVPPWEGGISKSPSCFRYYRNRAHKAPAVFGTWPEVWPLRPSPPLTRFVVKKRNSTVNSFETSRCDPPKTRPTWDFETGKCAKNWRIFIAGKNASENSDSLQLRVWVREKPVNDNESILHWPSRTAGRSIDGLNSLFYVKNCTWHLNT